MEITEKDVEDLIFDELTNNCGRLFKDSNTDKSIIRFDTFFNSIEYPNRFKWHRQLSIGDYGRIDIIGYTRFKGLIHIHILELKNVPIEAKDFDQIYRYKTAISKLLQRANFMQPYIIKIYLVGSGISSGHFIQNNTDCELITFKYSIRGFTFERHNRSWSKGDDSNLNRSYLMSIIK